MDLVQEDSATDSSRKALDYIQTIDFKTLGRTVFCDHLATVSDTGKEIGELTVSVEETVRGGEICYLVHAQSHGQVDSVPCGTSVTAYVGRGVQTLEQTQHEYIKIPNKPLDKKTVLVKEGNEYRIRRTTTVGNDSTEEEQTFAIVEMKGFISEGANIILQRVMAMRRDVPETATFLGLETDLQLAAMTYEKLPVCQQQIGESSVEVFGIERQLSFQAAGKTIWRTYFLHNGHMSSRQTLGSPVRMQLVKMPEPDERSSASVNHQTKELRWKEDMELQSTFLGRKEELMNDHATYIRQQPEIRAIIEDFCQFMLLRKPEDICRFASEYFAPLSASKAVKSPPPLPHSS